MALNGFYENGEVAINYIIMMKRITVIILLIILGLTTLQAQTIALLKYRGGGDWYANPTSLPNLIKFCNRNLETSLNPNYATVEVGSLDLFNHPDGDSYGIQQELQGMDARDFQEPA